MDQAPNQFDLIFLDICCEDAQLGLNPPAKFYESSFLNKLNEIASEEGGLTVLNTTILDSQQRKKCFNQIKAIPGAVKFSTVVNDDKNEVVYVAKGITDKKAIEKLEEIDFRNVKLSQAANSLKLSKGLFLNKEKMKVCHHAEEMRKL